MFRIPAHYTVTLKVQLIQISMLLRPKSPTKKTKKKSSQLYPKINTGNHKLSSVLEKQDYRTRGEIFADAEQKYNKMIKLLRIYEVSIIGLLPSDVLQDR